MTPLCRTRTALTLTVLVAGISLLSGCSKGTPPPAPLLLSGPSTNIVTTIPPGWHQVINSAQPTIPEMVTPIDCMGSQEVACATGLVRIATTTAPSIDQAAQAVTRAVTAGPGLTAGPITTQGPAAVGQRDGYRVRFTFSNARGVQHAQVAAVSSGPTTPDAQGNREYSVVLAWTGNDGPRPEVLDQVVDSVLVHGGESRR